jgi:predicted RNA binding protein YcfA (HicA-like mRNA interferase family)
MRRSEFIRYLKKQGCTIDESGGSHAEILSAEGKVASLPRHTEIQNGTAWAICKQLEIPKPPFR